MWLYFSSLSPAGAPLNHTLFCADLEGHVDTLNGAVAVGYQLLSAYLIDEEGRRTDLPAEVFDGQPMSACLRELEVEYQMLLNP